MAEVTRDVTKSVLKAIQDSTDATTTNVGLFLRLLLEQGLYIGQIDGPRGAGDE